MSGEWRRGTARLLRHRRPKGPETARPSLHYRVTPRLYGGQETSLSPTWPKTNVLRLFGLLCEVLGETGGEALRREVSYQQERDQALGRASVTTVGRFVLGRE